MYEKGLPVPSVEVDLPTFYRLRSLNGFFKNFGLNGMQEEKIILKSPTWFFLL